MVQQNPTSGLKGVSCFTSELIRALRAVHTRLVHGRFYMMIIPLQRPSVEVFDSNGDLFSRKSFNTVEPQTHEPLEVDIRTDHTADDDNEVLYSSDNISLKTLTPSRHPSQSNQAVVVRHHQLRFFFANSTLQTFTMHQAGIAFYKALSLTHDQETSRKIQKLDKLRYTQESQGQSSTHYSIRIYHHTGRNAAKATPLSDTSSRNYTYVWNYLLHSTFTNTSQSWQWQWILKLAV